MYGVSFDCCTLVTAPGQPLTVPYVLDHCTWRSEGEREALVRRLRKLKLGSAPVVIACRKEGGGVNVWHELSFSPCKNPYTGGLCLLFQERDVSALMLAQAELQVSSAPDPRARKLVAGTDSGA
eukprot:579495-Rhodomonas_salina.1